MNPLAPQPMTAEEIADLVRRTREASSALKRSAVAQPRARKPMTQGRLAQLHAEREHQRLARLAAARMLGGRR